MTEEKLNALRQTDANLRDALRMDEEERPQMPANLNERLMKRVVNEEKKPRRIIWPWIAAACVAGVMMIWLTPPKVTETPTDVVAENTPKVEKTIVKDVETTKIEETPIKVKEVKVVKRSPVRIADHGDGSDDPIFGEDDGKYQSSGITQNRPRDPEPTADLAAVETAKPQDKTITLTERDIPITRPENYQYTPEELALLKKQADEAYLKWVQLELEISKNNLQQTAQK